MEQKITKKSVLAYGVSGLGRQFISMVMSGYLLYYYVTVAGLSATKIGIMMMLAKIWDAINDPMMGAVVDNTHSKYGKVRPYLLYCSVPLAVMFAAMFAIPQGLSNTVKMVWATVTYVGTGMLRTMVDIPIQTLLMRITDDSTDRMRLQRSKTVIETFGCMIPPMLIPILIARSDDLWKTFAVVSAVFAVIAAVCYLITFLGTREMHDTTAAKVNVLNAVKTLAKNKYYRKYIYSYLFYGGSYSMVSGVMMFFITAKYHNAALSAITAITMMVGMFSSSVIAKNVADRIGKIRTSAVGMGIALFGLLLRIVLADSVFAVMAVGLFFYGAGISFYMACLQPMVAETVDYGELKGGVRVESMSFAGLTLTNKIGDALGTALVGILLDVVGYVEDAAEQTAETVNGLHNINVILPAFFIVAIMVIMLTNDMDKKYSDYLVQLKKKRMGAGA